MLHTDEWELIDCPVCAGSQFTALFEKGGQNFVRCESCTLVLINPRPKFEEIVKIYESNYSARYIHKRKKKLWRAARRVRQMRPYVASGRWLDIGCSAGFVLCAAKDAGFDVYGSDVDGTGLAYARSEFGIQSLNQGFFEDAHYPDAFFDVVTLYDVIEHVPDLNRTIAELARIIAPGGCIEIWTPDVGHWRRTRPLEDWNAIMPSKHLYYFSIDTFSALVERHGLNVVRRRWAFKPGLRMYLQPSA